MFLKDAIFSIDGIRNETLLKLRGIELADVLKGINCLNKIKNDTHSSQPGLQINYTANCINISELKELVAKFKTL